MSLRLFDSGSRELVDFVPLTPGQVGIYVCGATVQSAPHIGHLRPAVAFDILRRWLTRSGNQVTLIRNITDIDDKILAKAALAGTPWWAHAASIEREFARAYDALGVLPPTYEPRATQHVPEMITLMQELTSAGHAYTTGAGDVWFDVLSWPQYGELTHQNLAELEPDVESVIAAFEPQSPTQVEIPGQARNDNGIPAKHSPYDFALWKAPKVNEPATAAWDTPWGRGRPGWHLECTAMATKYLGPEFDIHGGGLDLRFPHHENEQAQARAAGKPFARHWMHTAWITQSGAKMSKSLGNGLLASEVISELAPPDQKLFGDSVVEQRPQDATVETTREYLQTEVAPSAPGIVVRYAIASVQYRSMLEWTPETLTDAATAWERLAGFANRATEILGSDAPTRSEIQQAELPADFVAAMDDDLNTSAALAVVHSHLRAGNTALADGEKNRTALRNELVAVRAMLDVLGLDPLDPHWATASQQDEAANKALATLIEADLAARQAARQAKDWAKADEIRDRLTAAGIAIEDSPTGPRWSLKQNG